MQGKQIVPKVSAKVASFIIIASLVLVMGKFSLAAEAVFVNALRETWPKEKLTLATEARLRYESLHNFNFLGYGNSVPVGKKKDDILLGRLRVGINYKFSERIRVSLWGYQANAWDFSIPLKTFKNPIFDAEDQPFEDRLELYKAYIEVRLLNKFKIKIGR